MQVQIANALKTALIAAAAAIAPPPAVDFNAWAAANITFAEGESQFSGRYNPDLFPFWREVLAALGPDDPCRIVTLQGSAQVGKTILATTFCLGSMDLDPCDFLFIHPTEENARRWSRLKLAKLMRSTPSIREAFPERTREKGDSILLKDRADGRGSILISSASSPSSLSQVSMRRQVQDDLSKWETDPKAGDPEGMADSRSQAFEDGAKILKISTPLVEPGCRITRSWKAGSQEEFHVPCPHCGHRHPLEWENLLASIDEDRPEDAHFTCPSCGCAIEEHHRHAMTLAGAWVAANQKAAPYHRSFRMWAAYSPLMSWERIAREWLEAKGDAGAEQVFLNDIVGRAFEAGGAAPDHFGLLERSRRAERGRGVVPAGHVVLTMGIDCQADRLEWQVIAWDRHRRRAVVDHGVVEGHIGEPATWPKLDAVVRGEWRTEWGGRLGIDRAAIDGNTWTEEVFAWAKRHPITQVIMMRGANTDNAPMLAKVKRERTKTGQLRPWGGRFYTANVSVLKLRLYRRLRVEDPEQPGYVDFPSGLDEEYFLQLTAEKRKEQRDRQGFSRYLWTKDPGQANEMLDTMVQAEVAAIRHGVPELNEAQWDALEDQRGRAPEGGQLDLEDMMVRPVTPATASPSAVRKVPRRVRVAH